MYDAIVPCKKCNNKVPASSLKLDFDLKMMVCSDCIKHKQLKKQIDEEVYHKSENAEEQSEKEAPKEAPMKVGHKCASCGYKFKVDMETKTPKACPYCNARILSY